jgi:hypothetical protein
MIVKVGSENFLEIFENFQIDGSLPKYTKENQINQENVMVSSNGTNIIWSDSNPSVGEDFFKVEKVESNLIVRFLQWLISLIKKEQTPKPKYTILEFFIRLASGAKELSGIVEIAEHYKNAIEQAKASGQDAQKDRLERLLDATRTEAHLVQLGLKKYVTEEQVVDFYELTDSAKNLKLTWIKNFIPLIPSDIIETKKELDDKELFDNYVILHYDPENKASKMTPKEKEYKKDPILFGVIKGSRKLYFVGDWKDEYCDLTLSDMFEKLGEKVFEANNRSVKTYIDKDKLPNRKYVK